MIWATPQPGEKVRDVRRHLASCFAVMGVPRTIKTDNGPAYISGLLKRFMKLWDIKHITGIPHSPTGQAIVERANGTIKQYVEKFKDITDVRERVNKTLFVLNDLCVFGDTEEPPIACHYSKSENNNKSSMRVLYRDMKTGQWLGPADVIYVGRGYICVSSPTGSIWVPSRCTKPSLEEKSPEKDDNDHG